MMHSSSPHQSPEKVYFFHLRKAGGTSLRNYLGAYASEKQIPLEVDEGYSLNHAQRFNSMPRTLHITSLRHPIERIKSSYRFEGRWKQTEANFRPETELAFAKWVAETRCNHRERRLWTCSENYYVKSLIGYPQAGANGLGRAELALAKRRLREFEIVLITEQFSNLKTNRYLQHRLGFAQQVPHKRFPQPKRPEASDEELFDQPTMDWLFEANRLDLELYQDACELFARRIGRHRLLQLPSTLLGRLTGAG